MNKLIVRLGVAMLFSVMATLLWASDTDNNTYPTKNRLFYIARSLNRNLVCYDAHIENGVLDTQEPLDIYWLNREENPGKTNGLNYFQKKMAYGYKLISKGDGYSEISLTAYPKRTMKICKHEGKYVCMVSINGQTAVLSFIYVKTKPSNSLSVEYVELNGTDVKTGEALKERVVND
ncbi:MAG: DUF4833 domain-containing protein [Parabacteroides distasonis]|nr:DUF4833 domain-containing protein [Parabacteroides distasonis]MBQ4163430.1 DUF4833 domain-containing protein [Parabacteroides sp.]